MVMDNTSTFEAYMMFRMTEAEHIAQYKGRMLSFYPEWVEQSANPTYEKHLYDAYMGRS